MLKKLFNAHARLSTVKRIDGMSQSYYTFLAHYIDEYESMFTVYNRMTLMQYLAEKVLAPSTKAVIAKGIGKFMLWNELLSIDDLHILYKAFRMPTKSWSEATLTEEQVSRIILQSRKVAHRLARYRNSSLITMLSTIGCRIGQALSLQEQDVSIDAGVATFRLQRQKERRRDTKASYDIKKLPLDISIGKWNVGEIWNQYLGFRQSEFKVKPDTSLFVNESGQCISVQYFRKTLQTIGKEMDIKLYPHLFRHFVGHTVANKQGLVQAAALLGHSTINITMKYVNPTAVDTEEIIACQYQKDYVADEDM